MDHNKTLFEAQEATVRLMHPDWTEEQIKERCTELQNHIIDRESNRGFANPVLQKIWEKKKKFVR